ncbi:MAG: tRNA lysidine(34) synthetase TilS [Clostridiales bacterium]|nr:tRNA lysidine(34) synthetase TilS [Clostridiales bacterium]
MIELLQKVAEVLAEYSEKRLAVGVSGGRDSMCLLHAVLHCGVVKKENIIVVHVNHCLRETADGDEAFVREYCKQNQVEFTAKRIDVKSYAAANGLTIEQAARDLRYGVFFDLVKSGKADVILTAHHALDNAESVLMHLFRGTGLDGVRGIAKREKTVRPLLNIYPDELDEYVQKNGIKFVVDETNLIDDADRNFIRINVIPLIEQRYRGAVRAVNEFAKECDGVCDYLDDALDLSLITYDGGAVLVADNALSTPLAARYVRKALEYFTLTDITREQITRVTELAHMRTGAVVQLTGGIEAAKEYGCVALYIPRMSYDGETPIKLGVNLIDGLAVDIERSAAAPREAAGRCVDLDKLQGAALRFRRDGDTFTPFGGGKKKLKQYFIGNKVPKRLRDRIPLICRGNEVLVIVGMQIADSVKQTDKTVNKGVVSPRW